MNGLAVLMFIFAFLIFLAGLYLYKGHKSELLLWRTHNVQSMTKRQLENVGKWTMIASIIPLLFGIVSLILDLK